MLSTILWRAIGVSFIKSNLNIARAITKIINVNEIGVEYVVIANICNVASKLVTIGTSVLSIIKADCFEKKPEFLIE